MKKILLVHGWFTQPGLRLDLNPQNGAPYVYDDNGCWRLFHGELFFKEDKTFDGFLYDRCGTAKIKGILKDGKLAFDKCYTHRKDLIHYELVQSSVQAEFGGTYTGIFVGTGNTKLTLTELSETFFVF